MSTQANYFKLGVFIIAGVLVLAAALTLLGLGAARKDTVKMETYFSESVQGIDVGSPVKFLGVKVGIIERITFAFVKYQDFKSTKLRYVLVEFGIDPNNSFMRENREDITELLKAEVARGLRIKVAPQGLTGTAYLEMTYVDPAKNPTLPIDWQPASYYVPSAPSTIARLEETLRNFSETLTKIREAGIDRAVENLNALLVALREAVRQADIGQIADRVTSLVDNLKATNGRIDAFLGSPEWSSSIKNFSETMENVKKGTDDLPQALADMRKLLVELSDILAGQSGDIRAILENTRETMENVNELTGDAKRNPARLFWGQPPLKKAP